MTTYYVSPLYGLDSRNGLSPDASKQLPNGPWATLGKALATGTPVLAGDTIYVGPGVSYQNGSITVSASGISTTGSPLQINGDPGNAQGFKDLNGVTVPPGMCVVTTRASTEGEDTGVWASTASLLVANAQTAVNGVQIRNLLLEAHPTAGACIQLSWIGNSDWTVEDNILIGFTGINYPTAVCTASRNLLVRRNECFVLGLFGLISSSAAATADADLNIIAEDNIVLGRLTQGGQTLGASGGNIAGGVYFRFNTVVLAGPNAINAITMTALRASTVTPIRLLGNDFFGGTAVNAGTQDQVVDDGYNWYTETLAATNFTKSPKSVNYPLPRRVWSSLEKWGLGLPRSDHFGWTDSASNLVRNSAATYSQPDWWGRSVRPYAVGPTVGAFEAPLVLQDGTSQIASGGAMSLALYAAGEVAVPVPVDAVATTITVVTKSTAYGGASYPAAVLVANPSLGVTAQTATATDATSQTLTLSVTPTAAGVLSLRLISYSTARSGWTFFDVMQAA